MMHLLHQMGKITYAITPFFCQNKINVMLRLLLRVNNSTTHLWVLAFVDVASSLNYTSDCPVHVTLCTRKDPAQIITHFTGALALTSLYVYPRSAL